MPDGPTLIAFVDVDPDYPHKSPCTPIRSRSNGLYRAEISKKAMAVYQILYVLRILYCVGGTRWMLYLVFYVTIGRRISVKSYLIMRVGVIEDDPVLAEQLKEWISLAGHSCFVFHEGQKLTAFLARETVDILLVDWNLPDMSGLELIRWSRHHAIWHPPVIMLTGRVVDSDIVTALRAGADEYITKPVQPDVLLARIEALFRLVYPVRSTGQVERFGVFEFRPNTNLLTANGTEIPLTNKEFALALLLFRNRGRTLSRSYIYEAVWGARIDLQTRTLETHVSKLRRKIGAPAADGFKLESIHGLGYRLGLPETPANRRY